MPSLQYEIMSPLADHSDVDALIGRALLRRLGVDDAPRILHLVNYDPDHFTRVEENIPDHISDPDKLKEWVTGASEKDIQTGNTKFGIWIDKELVGCIGYRVYDNPNVAELWCWVGKEYSGHGYANIATQILCDNLFEAGFERAEARIKYYNKASLKTIANAGFVLNGTSDGFLRYVLRNSKSAVGSGPTPDTLLVENF